MNIQQSRPTPLTVLYDADCGICTHTARMLVRLDRERRLMLVSLQAAHIPGSPPPADLEGALHATDGAGRWYLGASALVEIARRVPMLRPVTWLVRLPLAMPFLELLYDAVADNRQALSRVLGLKACRVPARRG